MNIYFHSNVSILVWIPAEMHSTLVFCGFKECAFGMQLIKMRSDYGQVTLKGITNLDVILSSLEKETKWDTPYFLLGCG